MQLIRSKETIYNAYHYFTYWYTVDNAVGELDYSLLKELLGRDLYDYHLKFDKYTQVHHHLMG
jgi:hypothetical protein